eukprot:6460455-Amphidinium_carterae.1
MQTGSYWLSVAKGIRLRGSSYSSCKDLPVIELPVECSMMVGLSDPLRPFQVVALLRGIAKSSVSVAQVQQRSCHF